VFGRADDPIIRESPVDRIGRTPQFVRETLAVDGSTLRKLRLGLGNLVGRDELHASVVEHVGAHRLVTLTGVGGVGKTRLAVEVAATIAPRFRDGVWFIDLAAVGDAATVHDAIASALGVAPQAGTPMAQTLVNALSSQHVLLVLDNCEHVLTTTAELVDLLLARPDGPRIVATSRERLQVSGEHEVPVPPLTVDDPSSPAVVLFVERARSVRPNFSLEDHPATATAVVEICRRLDGLPLGIELASARMAGMSVTDVRNRLDDRFRLLTGGDGAPVRQRSLPELVRWSYDLLDETERDLLRRAAVFVGGFDLTSFTGVFAIEDDTEVLRALDRLVRSSLVVAEHADGRVRYRLLETIRQFGIDELAATDGLDSSRDQHARWFARAVVRHWETHNGPGWRRAVDWLLTELADLRAAVRWAGDRDLVTAVDIAAHAGIIATSANLLEPVAWAESLVDAATAARVARLPRLLCACGYACFAGRPVAAAAHAEHAMRLEADPSYETCEPGLSAFIAALANVYAGRLDRYVELATIADSFGGASLAFARPALVDGLQASGRVDEALELVDSSVAAAREVASPFWLAYALWIAGITLSKVDPLRALSAWEEGLAVVREDGVDFFRGFLARDAARLHTTVGEADAALGQFDIAIDSFHRAGNIAQLIITLASLPELLVRLGEPAAAATLHAAMVKIPASVAHVPDLAELGEQLCAQLGPEATAIVAAGRAMDLDDAALYARAQIEDVQRRRSPVNDRPGGLSRRELEVLRLITDGLTTREIAERLFISAKTADRHIQNTYTKIGTSNRATATRWALDNGLVSGITRGHGQTA
jgi:predicted ATPase/DNA-binding CsgD family transcriptional regulator